MITDIPPPEDLKRVGTDFLYLAWNEVVTLLERLSDEYEFGAEHEEDFETHFWQAAQRRLSVAASLTALAAEQLLKARIAEVSAYALIPSPEKWPGDAQFKDRPFADFFAPDAQVLPKIHDTLCPNRLDPTFRNRLDEIRNRRNRIQHTVDLSLRLEVQTILLDVLDISHHLLGPLAWTPLARQRLLDTPTVMEGLESLHARHVQSCIRILPPASAKKYLGISRKSRLFVCPSCQYSRIGLELQARTAAYVGQSRSPTALFCAACQTQYPLSGAVCSECSARAIVDRECLNCGECVE